MARNVVNKIWSALLLSLCLCLLASHAGAGQVAGAVTHLSGPLLARKGDGSTRVMSLKSEVEEGDTLVTAKRTYAKVKFVDGSEVTLKPETQFKVEHFAFNPDAPADDSAVLSLVKGGLRSVTGKIGKRGNENAYEMKTPTATIGIRGTVFGATFCQGGQCGTLPPGLYVDVTDGKIVVFNQAGKQLFTVGQFGFVATPTAPPVTLPNNPGTSFTEPAAMSKPPAEESGGGSGPKPDAGSGCEVPEG